MGMPLDQLQQYAQKHMDDPVYGSTIVSMASYVANMKKAAQVPTTSPNQPTVAQQAVQSIAPPPPPMQAPSQSVPLPESQGIGQLPAKNLEGMADGGIAGYAGGGDTDKDRYPTHEEAVAAFNAAYPTPKYNQPEQRGPISQTAHDLMVQFHMLPDNTPGMVSPESQRAAVYGTSQIGHADGGPIRMGVGGVLEGLATANNISRLSDVPYIFDAVNSAKTGNYGDLIGSAVNAALPIGPALATYSADLNKNEDSDLNKHQYVQGHFGRTQRTWANGLAQGGRIHPGTISPEQQRASVYGASQIGHAAGGIIGYAGGGHVPSYAGITDGSFVMPKSQSVLGDVPIYTDTPLLPQQGAPENNQVPPLVKLYNDYMARRSNPANPMNHPGGIVPPQAAPAASPAGNITTPPAGNASTPTPTPAQPAPATTGMAAAPTVDPNAPNPYAPKSTGAGTGIGALNVGDPMALAKALGFSNKTLPEYTQDANALLPGNVTADDLNLSKQRQMIRAQIGRDPNFTDDIKKLDDQDAKAADTKNEKQGLALLMAGASMIGPGNWAENIAKGVGVGAKQYGDDLDKLRQAENERLKMRQNLEIAAYANNAGEVKEALGQVDQATARKDKHDDLVASTAASMFNANRGDIAKLGADYENNLTSRANAATAAGATLQASQNSMNAPLYQAAAFGAAQPGSALYAGHTMQRAEAMAGPLAEKYATYAAGEKTMGREPMSFDDYASNATRAVGIMSGTIQPVDQRAAALAWLKANPNDKNAPAVRAKLGLPNG